MSDWSGLVDWRVSEVSDGVTEGAVLLTPAPCKEHFTQVEEAQTASTRLVFLLSFFVGLRCSCYSAGRVEILK